MMSEPQPRGRSAGLAIRLGDHRGGDRVAAGSFLQPDAHGAPVHLEPPDLVRLGIDRFSLFSSGSFWFFASLFIGNSC